LVTKSLEEVALGEILKPVSRSETVDPQKTYRILGAHWYAKGLYIKDIKSGSQIQAKTLYRVEQGDFIYNRLFAWKGSFAVASEENHGCYVSNEFPCFSVNKDRIDGRYLWRYFSRTSVWEVAFGLSTGGTPTSRNRLKEEKLLAMRTALPSLVEQRRIVAKIDDLANKIEEAESLRRQSLRAAEPLFETTMKVIFDFDGAKKSVKDFASVFGGYAFSSDQYTENGSHQIVRIGNVRDGYLDLSRAPVRWDFHDNQQIRKYELKEEDILISMTGTRNKRDYGYIAIVPSGQRLLLNQRVGKIVLHKTIDSRYLYYFLRSPFFRDNLFPHATGTANQANIGNKHIEGVPFEPPENLDEQRRIVVYLDGLQARIQGLKQLQAQTDVELNALLPSILDKAFKGEL
jgi:type I restriction enzyme S subunit